MSPFAAGPRQGWDVSLTGRTEERGRERGKDLMRYDVMNGERDGVAGRELEEEREGEVT